MISYINFNVLAFCIPNLPEDDHDRSKHVESQHMYMCVCIYITLAANLCAFVGVQYRICTDCGPYRIPFT